MVCTALYLHCIKCCKVIQGGTWWYMIVQATVYGGTWRYMAVQELFNRTYWYVLECTGPQAYHDGSIRMCFSAGFAAAILHGRKHCIADQCI